MTQHRIAWNQKFDLEDDVGFKCSCREVDGTLWKRTRNLTIKKPSVRSSSLTDAKYRQRPLGVDSGAGETIMPVDWLTSHPLTESDGSVANDFCTTADGSKVYDEG